jgi:RNA polymerase sigma-70 factor (ECF subfamily)
MMLMESPTARVDWDDALIERAVRGDKRAFERIYRAHCGRVHALCLRMTRDTAMAEDCTQETFINAWRALQSFETRSSLSTWLHRIAVNAVLAKRRRTAIQIVELPEETSAEELDWTFDTPVEVEDIEAAVGALPEGARDVLILSGICGYSHGEAAQMLGIAEGTCKAQLHRARGLLRERLGLEITT